MANDQDVSWGGYWTASVTPFTRDGSIDMVAWRELLERSLTSGVHGIVVNGTSGEWFSQTIRERIELAQAAVEVVNGRVPVVAGVSSYTVAESALLAQAAATSGVDGVLATPPPYVRPTDNELFVFFRDIASSTHLPFMLYNWPRGTAIDMSLPLLERLAELDQIVAIKDSTADTAKTLQTLEVLGSQLRFFSRLINPLGLAVRSEFGGDGFIDGGALGAVHGVRFYEALWRDDIEGARSAAYHFNEFWSGLVRSDYSARYASPIAQIKAAMRILRQPGGWVRPPLLDLEDPEALASIRVHLEKSGFQVNA